MRNITLGYLCERHTISFVSMMHKVNVFLPLCQDLEQMAMEQDKLSDKQALMSQVEGHKKQMRR